jgi:hypothetical protein
VFFGLTVIAFFVWSSFWIVMSDYNG